MNRKNNSILFASALLVLSMLACNLGKTAPTSNGTEAPPQGSETEAPAGGTASGACANPYVPIVQGATWNYSLTGPVPDTFVRSIVSVDANGFTDQDVFGTGVTRQGKWSCDNGSLTALDPASGPSANVNTQNVNVDFQTTAASGVTLPGSINAGDSWTQTVTLEGTEDINGQQIPAKNEFSNTCTAASVEAVTVAAGSFDALRVDCQTVMTITITMNGSPFSTPVNITTTSWYAEGVGMVKSVTTGENLDSTIELTSYSIP